MASVELRTVAKTRSGMVCRILTARPTQSAWDSNDTDDIIRWSWHHVRTSQRNIELAGGEPQERPHWLVDRTDLWLDQARRNHQF